MVDRSTTSKSKFLDGAKTKAKMGLSSENEYFMMQSYKNSGVSVSPGTRAKMAQRIVSCRGCRHKVGMGLAYRNPGERIVGCLDILGF